MIKNKMLVVGLACVSAVAVAQQSQQKPAAKPQAQQVHTARETGSGMATGRRTNQKAEENASTNSQIQAREVGTGKATGRVATGDVDGDGADSRNSAHATEVVEVSAKDKAASNHTVKSPRDAASGLATGKRMHKPMTMAKPEEQNAAQAPQQ
ncbi:MAG: hypothetical protein JST79_17325 [Acidobacteria bacterium]|nr:hypothetical protein [Acidobacteriota bacterium]